MSALTDPMPLRLSLIGSMLLAVSCWHAGGQELSSAMRIEHAVFLGQLYPSGNVYLRAFENEGDSRSWPSSIAVLTLAPSDSGGAAMVHATYAELLDAGGDTEVDGIGRDFRPNERPASGEEHDFSDGFFYTMFDSSLADRNVARYVAKDAAAESLQVIAFDSRLRAEAIDYSRRGRPRPLTATEKTEVEEERATLERELRGMDCTTVPAFVDSAKELLRAAIAGTGVTIRISHYSNPGCAGHLDEVYLLDLVDADGTRQRFELHHYVGVL